jgi:riboflavin kinase/FMN adenylyltransferase
MKVFDGLDNLDGSLGETVVAIGVFDGVHRGHQEILKQSTREARSQGLTPVALTFDIHPGELFSPETSPPYIASLDQRIALIDELGGGIAATTIIHFDRAFAGLPPELFVKDVLKEGLNARHILVGADFCYGRGRSGNVTSLIRSGASSDFSVTVVPPILLGGERISSTRIRELVASGDIPAATTLLGHPFCLTGRVVRGKALGRTIGFPTANVAPVQHNQLLPADGVYAAWAHLPDGTTVRAAVSVGSNPTTDTDGLRKVEAFLMDGFSADLYDADIRLQFSSRLRGELKFDGIPALIQQIGADVLEITRLLPHLPASGD